MFVPFLFVFERTTRISALKQFSPQDLSAIARGLDELERSYDDNHRGRSTNMDDTGVYPTTRYSLLDLCTPRFLLDTGPTKSPGSLESLVGTASKRTPSAADGTSIRRLRQQTRKLAKRRDECIHEPPPVRFASRSDGRLTHFLRSTQLAFILNLNEHWFTLRRFGAIPKGIDDLYPGQGHWFNLNSFLRKPEWVGKLYLSMVLQQSEEEGTNISRCTVLIYS